MIPSEASRHDLQIGDWAKLLLVPPGPLHEGPVGERVWVEVTRRETFNSQTHFAGRLLSQPADPSGGTVGDTILFSPDNVLDIVFPQGLGVTVDDITPERDDPRENGNH